MCPHAWINRVVKNCETSQSFSYWWMHWSKKARSCCQNSNCEIPHQLAEPLSGGHLSPLTSSSDIYYHNTLTWLQCLQDLDSLHLANRRELLFGLLHHLPHLNPMKTFVMCVPHFLVSWLLYYHLPAIQSIKSYITKLISTSMFDITWYLNRITYIQIIP